MLTIAITIEIAIEIMLIQNERGGWKFEDSDTGQKQRLSFEAGLLQKDIADDLLAALLKALAMAKAKEAEIWRDIHQAIGTDPSKTTLSYNWVTGEITASDLDA